MEIDGFLDNIGSVSLFRAFERACGFGVVLFRGGDFILNEEAKEMLGRGEAGGYPSAISPVISELRSGSDSACKDITVFPGGRRRELTARGVSIANGDGSTGCLVILYDSTAARESERLQSEFVSRVSHELRTPLTTMNEFASILLDGLAGEISEKQRKFIGIIQNNIHRLTKIVGDLLDISRLEAGKIKIAAESASPDRLISQVFFSLDNYIEGKGLKLVSSSRPGLPPVSIDVDRIIQVLTNLIDNAAGHSKPGSSIEVGALREEGQVRFYVADSGEGIPAGERDKIFDRFHQFGTKPRPGAAGVGLGLSIAKQIVLLHGGDITAEDRPGGGSVFSFTVPAAAEHEDLPSYAEESVRFSRLTERKFTLMRVISGTENSLAPERLGNRLKNLLRKATDSNPFIFEDSFYIGLPNTGGKQAGSLAGRIKKSLPADISGRIKFLTATFPEDGGTAEEIIRKTLDLKRAS